MTLVGNLDFYDPYTKCCGEVPTSRGRRPRVFIPPTLELSAYVEGGNLIIVPIVGTGTFGSYNLYYQVNGVLIYQQIITEAGDYSITTPLQGIWLSAVSFIASAKIESISPLPAWSLEKSADVENVIPPFVAGDVTALPQFNFGVAVDYERRFAYAIRTTLEGGEVYRFDLTTGIIDEMPVVASYGIYLRSSDGSLYLENNKAAPTDFTMRRYLPYPWNPGDPLTPLTTGDSVDSNAEAGVFADSLDGLLLPIRGQIDLWPEDTLTSPTLYQTTPPSYAVHGLRWEDNKAWWIEGDQSSGHRWRVGGNLFTTLPPGFGEDIVPVPSLSCAVLVGSSGSTQGAWVSDINSGLIIYPFPGHGDPAIHGCFRLGNTVTVFDKSIPAARDINCATGTYEDISFPITRRFATGFSYAGKRLALPLSGAAWSDFNCGVEVW